MMKQASYIMTYRESDGKRRENLLTVLRWLVAQSGIEVIVVEQDRFPRLEGDLPHPECKRVFAYNPHGFNKSWGLNVGFHLASTAILGFADADVIIGGNFDQAIGLCAGGYQAVKPYRRLIDLTDAESVTVRKGNFGFSPQRGKQSARNREDQHEHIVFCGGVFFVRREAFVRMGAWDERFVGWGGEDDAMTYKLERLRISAVELDESAALHLWHPRTRATTYDQPCYEPNCALLRDYPRLTDAELHRLGEVQLSLMGNPDKHRPPAWN